MFSWLQMEGGLSEHEMTRTFNCGLGAVLVVAPVDAQRVLRQLQAHEEAWIVGALAHKPPGETASVRNLHVGVAHNTHLHFQCGVLQVLSLWWSET